ncbi:MAG: hypothetical protein IBJ03_15275 [Gemmatimonadaceae bacterium]|nr:hypothetical protein [Gemmatimonadaceae bacterium]
MRVKRKVSVQRSTVRRGMSLVELLVAMPLAALLGAVAVTLLLVVARNARTQGAVMNTSRELRHAMVAVISDLEMLAPGDLRVVQDSLIEFDATHATAVICGVSSNGTVLLGELGPTHSSPLSGVRAGDELRHWPLLSGQVAGADPHIAPSQERLAVGAASGAGTMSCGPAGAALDIPQWRVQVDSARVRQLQTGTPVRITRAARYVHYRSDGQWWLGKRTRDAGGWDVVQPVAGPLHSLAESGLRVTGETAAGAPTNDPAQMNRLRFLIRAPRMQSGRATTVSDSIHVSIALRGLPAQNGTP